MRTIPEAFSAQMDVGVTHFANVWRMTRHDGASFGFTDHDRALNFDALVCEPAAGLRAGTLEKSVGLSVDTASIEGALSSDAFVEAELARGLWDGALVEHFRVDWRDPSLRVHIFSGRLGEVRRGVHAFEAEVRGLQAALNKPVGRVFSRYCDALLGDSRCGKDIDTPTYRGEGVVAHIESPRVFSASGLASFEAGWFARGRVLAGGVSVEIATHDLRDAEAIFETLDPIALSLGDAIIVYAGCDKRFDTCRIKFENSVNFRGFPHMPGNDLIQSGPTAGQVMDGGSRQA
jgi:uncharacterized phage protein (TIGR02218 family)